MTDISSMTDQQLNEALAVEVMGWSVDRGYAIVFYYNKSGGVGYTNDNWLPSENLNQAVECAEKNLYYWSVSSPDDYMSHYLAEVWANGRNYTSPKKDKPARALSEAVLMAARG